MAEKIDKNERNLGVQDAAKKLKRSIPRVKQFAKAGRIGKLTAGRYLFSAAELTAFAKIERPDGRPKKSNGRA